MAQYEAGNFGGNIVVERNEDKTYFENRFVLRKIALTLLPIYNRLMFGLTVSGEDNLANIRGGMVTICNHVHTLDCTMVAGDFIDALELDTDHSIVEIDALHKWENQALESLDMRTKYGLNVIAIRSQDHLNVSPVATDVIRTGDKLVVIGDNADINDVTRLYQSGN